MGNNPVNRTDPLGLLTMVVTGDIPGVIADPPITGGLPGVLGPGILDGPLPAPPPGGRPPVAPGTGPKETTQGAPGSSLPPGANPTDPEGKEKEPGGKEKIPLPDGGSIEIKPRGRPGTDGATSDIVIIRDSEGNVTGIWHIVTGPDGTIIEAHPKPVSVQ